MDTLLTGQKIYKPDQFSAILRQVSRIITIITIFVCLFLAKTFNFPHLKTLLRNLTRLIQVQRNESVSLTRMLTFTTRHPFCVNEFILYLSFFYCWMLNFIKKLRYWWEWSMLENILLFLGQTKRIITHHCKRPYKKITLTAVLFAVFDGFQSVINIFRFCNNYNKC